MRNASMWKGLAVAVSCALLAAACAAPPWEGMSESQIAAWRGVGVESQWARTYGKAGLEPADVKAWTGAGIPAGKDILAWKDAGFEPAEAGDWAKNGFDLNAAVAWKKQKFSATEATTWHRAGFSVGDAADERAKGLAPVR
jgi:hypothetical protein